MATATKTTFADLYKDADAAGRAAAEACVPTPMIVGEAKSLFDDTIDTTKPTYFVADGVCGFAWVFFKGNTAWGRWASKNGIARKAYGGGLQIWVSGYGQSVARKEAYARAFAATLNEAGITAYAGSRLD